MKIRAGFVSNSSSTSFLIVAKEDLTEENFLELMGVDKSSPLISLFQKFFESVKESFRSEVDFKTVEKSVSTQTLFADIGDELSPRMLEKIVEARKKGLKVYYGWLGSESTNVEMFFATDSFEVENDKLYFNGLECVW